MFERPIVKEKSTKLEQVLLDMSLFYMSAPVGVVVWKSNTMGNALNRAARYVLSTKQADQWRAAMRSRARVVEQSEMTRVWPKI